MSAPVLEKPRPRGGTDSLRPPPRVAIACSGLGHVTRGVEAWADDLASALRRRGIEAHLFQGGGESRDGWRHALRAPGRFGPEVGRAVRRFARRGGWRYGFGNPYQAEQTLFARRLWPRVRRDFDVLHAQDPWLALLMHRLNRAGLSRARVILGHGTEEETDFLRRFGALQHLAPCYLDAWREHRPARQSAFAVPNFVDVGRFRPGDRRAARAAWGLPADSLVVLCVAAIKRHHKRVDYLLEEFARFSETQEGRGATLVVAGGREAETDTLIQEGTARLGPRVRFLEGVGRDRIPDLYRAADVFALASLTEMMPIAVLEALASGLPVACSDTPTLRWMVGGAGEVGDLGAAGGLTAALRALSDPARRARLSRRARARAEDDFSEGAVIPQVLAMYADVTAKGKSRE